MKLKPLHDWAVLVPSTAEEKTAGGLFIPDTAKEKPREGVVESVGPGAYEEEKRAKKEERKERKFIPTVVKPGDRVLYESWAGQTVKLGAEERVLVRERSILGLIERPLQIPSRTSGESGTALAPYVPASPAKAAQEAVVRTPIQSQPRKEVAQKKITAKKKAEKKKASGKTVKKKTAKKAAKPAKKKTAKPAKAGKGRTPKAKKSGKKK